MRAPDAAGVARPNRERPASGPCALRAADPPAESARDARDARFRLLFDDSYEFVGRLLRRFGVPRDAIEDATQEVFLVASRRLDDIAPGRERSFVFGVAMRVASGRRRRAARERRSAPDGALDARPALDPSPEALAGEKRERELLDRTLERMACDLRSVVVLFELEEMTAVEIARRLAIPQGTVMSRLRRARQQLRELVEGAEGLTRASA
ncbi:MAG: sigma-70 family RNA polymerase sigma factor [Polyangiaceae bacterium]|nr:sigma-70 family RNA polymerase sigma factor [Polyangiaceae bacterium]